MERPAVKMALARATLYAQRQKSGKNVSYRLADAGEKYLAKRLVELHERNPVGTSNATGEEAGE